LIAAPLLLRIIERFAGGKSKKDFIYKLRIVQEEADESCFWLEFIIPILKSEIGLF